MPSTDYIIFIKKTKSIFEYDPENCTCIPSETVRIKNTIQFLCDLACETISEIILA